MSDIKQLAREAAEKLSNAGYLNAVGVAARVHLQPHVAAIIESVLTNSDLFREGYERAKEDAAGLAQLSALASAQASDEERRNGDPRYQHKAGTALELKRQIELLNPDGQCFWFSYSNKQRCSKPVNHNDEHDCYTAYGL